MARYLTFRFDDGFMTGARTAAAILAPDKGSFFLVADLVRRGAASHPEALFRGRDFGSVGAWKAFAESGQDIQPHGCSHRDLTDLSLSQQNDEVRGSLALAREIHDGPYVFCHPFNKRIDLDFPALGLAAAGFDTRTSDEPVIFHRLTDPFDWYALTSWAVRERHFDKVIGQLALLPDDTWTILAFHSLDGEGHEPWSSAGFVSLVSACRDLGLTISTVSEMVGRTLQSSRLL